MAYKTMKIKLTLESGLEADFIPDFKLDNHSQIDKVKWNFPNKQPNTDSQLIDLEAHILGEDEKDKI